MKIRKVKSTDNAALARVIRAVFEEFDAPRQGTVFSDPTTDHLFELFRKKDAVLWVCEVDEKPLGCCGIFPSEGLPAGCVELVKFYLAPEMRGKGIGRELMKKSIASAREMGYSEVYLESLPEFSAALHLYESTGFEVLDAPLCNSEHPGCDVWMIKKLNPESA